MQLLLALVPGTPAALLINENIHGLRGKLLEIGCFDGYLLKRLKSDKWDVYGCDPANQTSIAIENIGSDRIINDFFFKILTQPMLLM